jgi:hypothetical protein
LKDCSSIILDFGHRIIKKLKLVQQFASLQRQHCFQGLDVIVAQFDNPNEGVLNKRFQATLYVVVAKLDPHESGQGWQVNYVFDSGLVKSKDLQIAELFEISAVFIGELVACPRALND